MTIHASPVTYVNTNNYSTQKCKHCEDDYKLLYGDISIYENDIITTVWKIIMIYDILH